MKRSILIAVLFVGTISLFSCSKDKDSGGDPITAESANFVTFTQGTDPASDTVYKVTFDASNRISRLVDSYDPPDTLTTTYDANSNLVVLTERYDGEDDNYNYTYNSSNQLTQYTYWGGEKYVFSYTNGVIAKKEHYSNNSLFETFVYTVADGNITDIKVYSSASALKYEVTLTYTSDDNVLKGLYYVNGEYNMLGMNYDLGMEPCFCKNLLASYTINGVVTTYTYTFNANKHLTKYVASSPESIYTRFLGY